MSKTGQRLAGRALLLAIALCALAVSVWPARVFAQASYTWRNVQIYGGGFITGIVFNQTEANLVYVRTDIGGAYRLDNATSRWAPLLDSISWDDWNLTGVVSIATDPVNPNNVYIAAGGTDRRWCGRGCSDGRRQDRVESCGSRRALHDRRWQDVECFRGYTSGCTCRVGPCERK